MSVSLQLSRWSRPLGVTPVLALVAAMIIGPGLLLCTYAFRESTFGGIGAGPTLQQFELLRDGGYFIPLAIRTVGVGLAVGAVVTVLAVIMCYGIRFNCTRRTGNVILGIALAAGVASFLVRIYAWGTILGTRGLVNSVLERVGLVDGPLAFLFFGYFAVVVTMSYLYLPIGLLVVYGAMQDIDPHSLEAGRDLGAGRWRTAAQVVLPQVRPALLSSFVLITVLSSADYVTPSLVGGTKGQMVGSIIRSQALASGDLPNASAIALAFVLILVLVLAIVIAILASLRFVARLSRGPVNAAAQRVARLSPRGLARFSVSKAATVALVAYLVTPTLVVLVFSFNDASNLGLPWRGFTLDWYGEVLRRPGFSTAAGNSLTLAVVSSLVAVLIGTPFAFVLSKARGVTRPLLSGVAMLPFVVPGVLIGLGLLSVADYFRLTLGLTITAAAHVLLLLPIVVAVVVGRLAMLNPELPQAARDLGSSPSRAFRTVTLPLILPSLLGTVLVGAAFSLDEIFVTTFTIGSDTTLPIWIFSQARVGFDPGLNALGVYLVGATLALPALGLLLHRSLVRYMRHRGRHAQV